MTKGRCPKCEEIVDETEYSIKRNCCFMCLTSTGKEVKDDGSRRVY